MFSFQPSERNNNNIFSNKVPVPGNDLNNISSYDSNILSLNSLNINETLNIGPDCIQQLKKIHKVCFSFCSFFFF